MKYTYNMLETVQILKDDLSEKDKLIRSYEQALHKIYQLSIGDPKLLQIKLISEHYLRIRDKEEDRNYRN